MNVVLFILFTIPGFFNEWINEALAPTMSLGVAGVGFVYLVWFGVLALLVYWTLLLVARVFGGKQFYDEVTTEMAERKVKRDNVETHPAYKAFLDEQNKKDAK